MVAQNPLAEIASHLDRYPDTRFVDALLADGCGIPRGKRLTIEELPGVYRGGFLLPEPWVREPVAQMQVAMHERDGCPLFGDPRHCDHAIRLKRIAHGVAMRHGEFRSFEAQVSALDHQWYLRC